MAKDSSRRPTPRSRSGSTPRVSSFSSRRQARSLGPAGRPAAKRPTTKKLTAPRSAEAGTRGAGGPVRTAPRGEAAAPRSSRPAFLDRAAGGARPAQAAPRPAAGAERRQRHQRRQTLRVVAVVGCCLAAVALVLLVGLVALRDASIFSIESVEAEPTEHVSESDLQNLINVPVGSTLLNLDEEAITEDLLTDPWVADVIFERVFPHTLKITVVEQEVDALVVMSSGSVAWYLSSSGTWIQPVSVETSDDQSVNDAALAIALEAGCLLITDVPTSVSPVAGSEATDDVFEAIELFRDGFSDSFNAMITCYSAPATDSISCTLSNGVEVLLGSASDISAKEEVVTETLEELADGSVTYINVRVVSSPAVRMIDSDNVASGSGVVAQTTTDDTEDTDDSAESGDSDA